MNREVFEELSLYEIKYNSLNNAKLLCNLIKIKLNPTNSLFNPSNHAYICKKIENHSELSLEEIKILIENRIYYYENFIERLRIKK